MGNTSFTDDYFSRVYRPEGLRVGSMNWWSARFYALACQRQLRQVGGKRLLEVGCAHGFILRRLQSHFECTGSDIWPPELFATVQQELPRAQLVRWDVCEPPPAELNSGYDLILSRYVFEHLERPQAALQHCAGLLRPGGRLLFTVPNMDQPLRHLRGEAWYAFQDPTHIMLLPPGEWLELTRQAGLRVLGTYGDGLWDMPLVGWLPTGLQRLLGMLPAAGQMLSGRLYLPHPYGENLLVVAEKPA